MENKIYYNDDLLIIKNMEYPSVLTKKVKEIDISNNFLTDISFLSKFKNIENIRMNTNLITDITPLKDLDKLSVGDEVLIKCNVSSREYNGKYFHNIDGYWFVKKTPETAMPDESVESFESDGLPF